jgi:group I intron endonuclease
MINFNFYYGPHILPDKYFVAHGHAAPIKLYKNAQNSKNNIIINTEGRALIYSWINLITGQIYIGKAKNGAKRLSNYWMPSVLKKKQQIYFNINEYSLSNFALIILEDLGLTENISPSDLSKREQYYINLLRVKFPELALNKILYFKKSKSNLNIKHNKEFVIMKKRDMHRVQIDKNNHQYGNFKSAKR